ncbi:hypothetical protein HanPI659440_Chr16g0649791 [Helianthus annuus]|nr:hypothetical protein HanPI659440_Chr16g0649791 [Helianthus annuus]
MRNVKMVFLMRNFITKYNQDMITDIAKKWSKVARTGGIEVKFMGVDVSTIMFTLEKGQDTLEVCSNFQIALQTPCHDE